MKRIANFKEKHKALLADLLPEHEKEAFTQHNVVNVLKDRDHKGRRVMTVNCGGNFSLVLPFHINLTNLLYFRFMGHFKSIIRSDVPFVLFSPRSRNVRTGVSSTWCCRPDGL